jgi:Protein of unknown function (DUF1822)
MFTTEFDVTDWTQAIDPGLSQQAWQRSQLQSTPGAQWNAYLNQIGLAGSLACLQALGWPHLVGPTDRQADRTWSLVNGSAIQVGNQRLALLPTEAVDQSELAVPQEWMDIPSWAADYYLAVYLMPDMQTLHIAGYATHQQIKTQAQINISTRHYYLDHADLSTDLNLLRLTLDQYATTQTRAAIAQPPELSTVQAQNLIQRLGAPTELLPRLEVPFATWAALLDNPTWHEQLYRQRQGAAASNVVTQLAGWMQGQFDRSWQAADAVLAPQQLAIATRSAATEIAPSVKIDRAKVIIVGDGQVGLLVNLEPLDATEVRIDLQIHPTGNSIHLPGETQLRLLDMDGAAIAEAKAAITETIRLQFRANYGEAFQLEIRCNHEVVMEQFVL